MYTCMYTITMEKEAMDRKETKEEYMEGFEGRKRRNVII